jgi:competence protein ComEC
MAHIRRPVVLAFLAYLAGVLAGLRITAIPPGAALLTVLIALVLVGAPRLGVPRVPPRHVLHAILGALACAGAGQGADARLASRRDCRAALADGTALHVRGVLGANLTPLPDGRIPLLPIELEEARTDRGVVPGCRVEARIRLPRGTGAMLAGTELQVDGAWWKMPKPVAPSAWPADPSYAGFVFARKVSVVAQPALAAHPLLTLRGWTERRITRLFPRNAPLADALLLGRRETLDRELAARFAQSGLVHLLAISGSHVALIGAVLLLLARAARLRRSHAVAATVALVTMYLAVIGAPPSAVRSGIMLALALAATVLQRPTSPLAPVAAAALAILAVQPIAALDIGFQLSFAGVLGLIVVRPAMLRRVPPAWKRRRWAWLLTDSLVTSLAAFLTTAPVVAHHFGQVAPVSIIANLPAIPLTSLALVGTGAALATEPLLPPVGRLFADGASAMLDGLQRVVDAAAALPGGHAPVSRPRWGLWAAAALAVLLALEWSARMRGWIRASLAASAACAAFMLIPATPLDGGLEIAFLDVGQGDAVAIRTPAGRWLLVDAGPVEDRFDAGEKRVLPFLRSRGADGVEAMILTHPHADHVGGAGAVLRGMRVGRVVEPGLPFGTPLYRDLLRTVDERGVPWSVASQDRVLRIDGVELLFLWPSVRSLDSPADANDISAVVQIRYGEFSALLTGDAPSEVEEHLVSRYGAALRSDVLKAGHHGSRTATSDAFLRAVQPELAVISCGVRNRYRHPAPETLHRLEARSVPVARTDLEGTVVVRVEPGGASWERAEP